MSSIQGLFDRQATTERCDCGWFTRFAQMPNSPFQRQESGMHMLTLAGIAEIAFYFCPLCGGVLSDINEMPVEIPENTERVSCGTCVVLGLPKWFRWPKRT